RRLRDDFKARDHGVVRLRVASQAREARMSGRKTAISGDHRPAYSAAPIRVRHAGSPRPNPLQPELSPTFLSEKVELGQGLRHPQARTIVLGFHRVLTEALLMVRRREFLILFGAIGVGWTVRVPAQ